MTSGRRIASRQHPIVRRCRDLAAGRGDAASVLLDGEHLIADALEAGVRIDALLTDGGHRELVDRAARAGAEVYDATAPVLEAASPVRTASGIVAIASWAPTSIEEVLETDQSHLERPVSRPAVFIGLVDVQDPGNVGAVIRSADAFGGAPVLVLGRSADPSGWKVQRGAMGSTFRVPVARGSVEQAIQVARARGLRVAATTPSNGSPIADADWTQPTLVLLGSEGAGLAADVVQAADVLLTIPMRAQVNSLNVAATATVLLYEIQRRTIEVGAR